MNKEYILYFIFLFIISFFNQCHNKYLNKTVEIFSTDDNLNEINIVRQEILELLERLESYIKIIINFKNFNNNKFLNENLEPEQVAEPEESPIEESPIEEFVNYSIEGCNKDYESIWKEDFKTFTSREEIMNYVLLLNTLYDKNISKSIKLKENILDDIYIMKKILDNSTDTDFVNCEQITPKQQQIVNKYCVLNDESVDLFTKQKIKFTEDVNAISNNICTLIVNYNDLHHIVKEIIEVNGFLNSIWDDDKEINKTNVQFKTE